MQEVIYLWDITTENCPKVSSYFKVTFENNIQLACLHWLQENINLLKTLKCKS